MIAWNRGAMRETVAPGCGRLVSSYEQLVAAVREAATMPKDQMDAVRRACVENASRFSVQNMISRYEELCLEAIRTGGW